MAKKKSSTKVKASKSTKKTKTTSTKANKKTTKSKKVEVKKKTITAKKVAKKAPAKKIARKKSTATAKEAKAKAVLKKPEPVLGIHCANCHGEAPVRHRVFSDKAITALVTWEEIEVVAASNPICEECYTDLRDVLIDRASELDAVYAKHGNTIVESLQQAI